MEQFDDLFNLSRLVSGYLKDDLTEKEEKDLLEWLAAKQENHSQFERLISDAKLKGDYAAYRQNDKVAAWSRILKETGYHKARKLPTISIFRIAAAASVLIFLSFGAYFFLHKRPVQLIAKNQTNDVLPGSNKAILTLANGKKFILTGALNGKLAQQGNTTINKSNDGQVVYTASKDSPTGENLERAKMVYDTLTIPRKGQYQLKLSDGSKVWLNAASSIRYPENFIGNERKVELLYGEAYFEVVHNAAKPFRVVSSNQTIEDIGTHFNINAYQDEPLFKTTLLEGSIKIIANRQSTILKPGEQARIQSISANPKITLIRDADIEEAISWKNGLFIFNDEPLESIMRKISRWYDVDVSYQNIDPHKSFWGGVSRYDNVSKVLRKLELTGGVHFTIEGRRIIARK